MINIMEIGNRILWRVSDWNNSLIVVEELYLVQMNKKGRVTQKTGIWASISNK